MGRPKIAEESKRVAISITVAPETLSAWKIKAAKEGKSLGEVVDVLIDRTSTTPSFSVHQIIKERIP